MNMRIVAAIAAIGVLAFWAVPAMAADKDEIARLRAELAAVNQRLAAAQAVVRRACSTPISIPTY